MIKLNNKIFLSWDDIKNVVEKVVEKIGDLKEKPFYLYGIPRGGLIPATWISHKTGIKYQQINSSQISKTADLSHILVIDDICDSGKTLKEIRENYPKIQIACLYYKKTASETPDIYGEIVGDEWLVFPWESNETPGQRDNTYEGI